MKTLAEIFADVDVNRMVAEAYAKQAFEAASHRFDVYIAEQMNLEAARRWRREWGGVPCPYHFLGFLP